MDIQKYQSAKSRVERLQRTILQLTPSLSGISQLQRDTSNDRPLYRNQLTRLASCMDELKHVLAELDEAKGSLASTDLKSVTAHELVLSKSELLVFQQIGLGLTTVEMAKSLHVSVKTIESHRAKIKRKLGITTAAMLSCEAVRWVTSAGRSENGAP